MMELSFNGRSALVVGASKGLGRAIALQLAQEGCAVAAVGRTSELLDSLQSELDRFSDGNAVFSCDLMADRGPQDFAKRLTANWLQPDIVVHNLGGSLGITETLASAADYQRVWQLNVGVPVELNRAFIPLMEQRGWGRIVHISSVSAATFQGYSAYVSAKAALNGYVKSLARSMAPKNIVVSAVGPGPIFAQGRYLATLQQQDGHAWHQYCEHHLPIGRLAQPDEIAPFVALLCSPLASYAIGTITNVDGGSQ